MEKKVTILARRITPTGARYECHLPPQNLTRSDDFTFIKSCPSVFLRCN